MILVMAHGMWATWPVVAVFSAGRVGFGQLLDGGVTFLAGCCMSVVLLGVSEGGRAGRPRHHRSSASAVAAWSA